MTYMLHPENGGAYECDSFSASWKSLNILDQILDSIVMICS